MRTWHAICFREVNNGRSKQAYIVTDVTSCICGKKTEFVEMLISPLLQFLCPPKVAEWWLTLWGAYL